MPVRSRSRASRSSRNWSALLRRCRAVRRARRRSPGRSRRRRGSAPAGSRPAPRQQRRAVVGRASPQLAASSPQQRRSSAGSSCRQIGQQLQASRAAAARSRGRASRARRARGCARCRRCPAAPRAASVRLRRSSSATAAWRWRSTRGSRSGRFSQRRSRRLPMAVAVRSSTPASVCRALPDEAGPAPGCAGVAASMMTASLAALDAHPGEVGQGAALGVAARTAAGSRRRDAEAAGRRSRSRPGRACRTASHSGVRRLRRSKCQGGRAAHAWWRASDGGSGWIFGHQQLGRPEALELAGERLARCRSSLTQKTAAGQVEPGQPEASAVAVSTAASRLSRRSSSSASSVTVPGVTMRTTWRSTGPLAGGGVADLLADRDRLALPDQPRQVALRRVVRARRPSESARRPTGRARSA